MEPVVDERIRVRARDDEDRPAAASVAAAGTTARDELLAAEGEAAAPAVSGRDADVDLVNEGRIGWFGDWVIG
jgi:hypothetical protein